MIYYFTSRAYVIICGRIFVRVCFGFFRILCFIWIRMTKNVSSLLSPQIFSTLFIKRCDQSQTDSPWAEVLFPETFLLWYIVPVLWQRLGKLKSKKEKINYWVFIVGLSIRENWEGICCWSLKTLSSWWISAVQLAGKSRIFTYFEISFSITVKLSLLW